ncbi:hypothetical protein GP486_001349 [Trichoglossum hirsutum]|uniref:Uncharacterized protein n=1 Tax=Trichoglossum hirsutum TaxID=265104 RepID=A0A9P8LGT9_9PEZI|nr:hypothetical protein GP486_001349 [Trichoglossum hirsutum]
MDLEYGRRVWDHIMNDPAYDGPDDEFDEALQSRDPEALFEQLGFGGAGGLPLPSSFPEPMEVRSKARALSGNVLNNWKFLNTIIVRHEAIIQKRWLKKTKEQRKKILLAAWPNVSLSHRPDFDAFKRTPARQTGDSGREAYMWPYINLEDLLKPKLLLLFLNSRGRNKPDAFARADIDACRFGLTTGALVPAFLNEFVMMFTGRHTPDTYGELISWGDHPEAFDWLTSQRGIHPGEGLLILEIQERLYEFLVNCSKAILHDRSEEELADPSIPIQPEPPSVSDNETGLASLSATAAEAPYRLPANLDLRQLESLVAAKLSAVEDHVWALREDPGYFARTVLDWKEHRQECLHDTKGRGHPVFDSLAQEPVFWERVIGNSVVTALTMTEIWGSIHEQIVDLQRLKEKYTDSISPEKDLPEEYAFAFYKLDHHLRQFSKGPIGNLKIGFAASPPMRPYFVRLPQDPTNTKIQIVNRTGLARDKTRDELIWIFMTLFDERQLHLAGLNTLMDELERLMKSDPKMRELVSPWVAHQISDLSVFSQCLHQIELYQPWAATFETEMVNKEDELKKDYLKTQKYIEPCIHFQFGGAITSLGTPSSGRFYYPVDKRRTRENTEAIRQAEKHLDAFWGVLDRKLMSKGAISPRLRQVLSQQVLQRTPEWIEPTREPKPEMPAADIGTLTKPLSMLHFQLEQSTEGAINREKLLAPKAKVKTRGVAQPVEAIPEPELPDQRKPDAQPTFAVDKRALKVFKTIFFTPSASSQPGEVAWGDFLHAMSSVGFVAKKLYGSAWQFTPTKLDAECSIQFHEPHPSGKIPFTTARRHGRRLTRAYGWHGEIFVLE